MRRNLPRGGKGAIPPGDFQSAMARYESNIAKLAAEGYELVEDAGLMARGKLLRWYKDRPHSGRFAHMHKEGACQWQGGDMATLYDTEKDPSIRFWSSRWDAEICTNDKRNDHSEKLERDNKLHLPDDRHFCRARGPVQPNASFHKNQFWQAASIEASGDSGGDRPSIDDEHDDWSGEKKNWYSNTN